MDNRIKQLISQIKNEAADEQEAAEVEQQMEKLWELSAQYQPSQLPTFDTNKNLNQLKNRIQQEKARPRPRRLSWFSIAASLLFLLLGAWIINIYFFPDNSLQTFYNQGQENETLVLSDGSEVNIYPGAEISYPRRFARNAPREVSMKGTAYFEVEADEQHPFIIQTPKTRVKVVGTAFLLKAEPAASATSIQVDEGKVFFFDKSSQREILVPAQQLGICLPEGILFQEPQQIDGILQVDLRDQPLARLFAQMERHHESHYELQEAIKQCRLTGTFDLSNPEKVLRQINALTAFNVSKIEENTYRISGTCE